MPHNHHLSYEFGPYRLDPNERVLTRAGDTISLTPKAIEILLLLVTNAGLLVEKDALLQQVWPESRFASQIPSVHLTLTEEVQILCSVARDQIAIGNFEAANLIPAPLVGAGEMAQARCFESLCSSRSPLHARHAFGGALLGRKR